MRSTSLAFLLSLVVAGPLQAEEASGPGLMTPNTGLMFWTLMIFVMLFLILRKWAFPVLIASVEAREKALDDAINAAKRDREEAMRLLAEHRAALDASRQEGQALITEARSAAERVRSEMVESAQKEQTTMIARARAEIESEKTKAIADLRREAVELAIAGAGKVIDRNLDQAANRQLVERFLASVTPAAVTASR
jgi:F-type H+-transporting ATPase subunit b